MSLKGRLSPGSRRGSSDQIRTHELSGSQASDGECSFHVGQTDLKVCFGIYSDQASSPCTKQSPPSPLEVSLVTGLTFQFSVIYNQLKFKKYDIENSRSFKTIGLKQRISLDITLIVLSHC